MPALGDDTCRLRDWEEKKDKEGIGMTHREGVRRAKGEALKGEEEEEGGGGGGGGGRRCRRRGKKEEEEGGEISHYTKGTGEGKEDERKNKRAKRRLRMLA